jgi:hypothetical protein
MKLKIIFSLLIIVLFTGCEFSQTLVTPVDDISTKEFSFNAYSDLIVSHAFKVQVYFSDKEESIKIEANENLHQYIKVVKDGYALQIGLADNILIKGKATLKAYVTTRMLNSFSGSGASRIAVEDIIKETDVAIDLSGASYFTGEVNAEEIIADISGASEINVSGFTNKCSVSASGASKFKDYTLETDYLYGDLSGASKAYITINKEISIQASGASHLYYKGQASPISQDLSGGSKIIKTE